MPPKKSKVYKMPAPLPINEVLTDTAKQTWTLGPSIAKGGFGEIYAAAEGEKAPSKESEFCFVIKIEPHENGPLFVEKTFYLRAAKKVDVESWMQKKRFKTFGMPVMRGVGSHTCAAIKYRFLVMERYSKDLWSLFLSCNKKFPLSTVLQVSTQVLDVLEYIHSNGYVHADIKGANLLLGLKKGTENQVYVVDFGLASRFSGTKDPRNAHNGTPEYTSRDAHAGGTTCRGDMEILAYNIVQWLSSKLPWDGILNDLPAVQKAKESAMQNVPEFLKKCFAKKPVPDVVSKFVKYVAEMEYEELPDYIKVRKMFVDGLKAEGVKLESPLSFTKPLEQLNGEEKKVRTSPRKAAKIVRRAISCKALIQHFSSSDQEMDSDSENEEADIKVKKRKIASRAKPQPKEKVSWRDCPTVKASRVERPGELLPLNPKPKPKKRAN